MICKILGGRIGSFYGNSVNEGDLNFAAIVSRDVPLTLTFITLGGSTNFGRVYSEVLLRLSLFMFLKPFFREKDGVLDLLDWEDEEVLDTLDFEPKPIVL